MTHKGNYGGPVLHGALPSPAVFSEIAVHKFDGIVAIGTNYLSLTGYRTQQSVIGRYGITGHPTNHATASPARTTAAKMMAFLPVRSRYSIHSSRGGVESKTRAPYEAKQAGATRRLLGGCSAALIATCRPAAGVAPGPRETSFTSATQAQAKVSVKPPCKPEQGEGIWHLFPSRRIVPPVPSPQDAAGTGGLASYALPASASPLPCLNRGRLRHE